jgi:hypothetical protein
MSIWGLILVVVGGLFAVSILAGVAVAAILGRIGRESFALVEFETFTVSPLVRAAASAREAATARPPASPAGPGRA